MSNGIAVTNALVAHRSAAAALFAAGAAEALALSLVLARVSEVAETNTSSDGSHAYAEARQITSALQQTLNACQMLMAGTALPT